jgi:hypothetical protein
MKSKCLSIAIISQTLYECRWVKWLGEQFKMEALSLSVLQYFRYTRLGGKQQDSRGRVRLAKGDCQFHAIHAGHEYIRRELIWPEGGSLFYRFPTVVGHSHVKAGVLKNLE